MSETKRDYEIGYGKPPRGGPFQKGRFGGPRGPCPKSLPARLVDALNEKVVATIDESAARSRGTSSAGAARDHQLTVMTEGAETVPAPASGGADIPPERAWRDLTSFWGKARPPADRPSPSYHPLIFHSLDVAAVGQVLLARWPGLAAGLATALGWEVEAANALLIRLLALHDLGKFARRFQAKSPAHYDESHFGSIEHVTTDYDHASGGYALLQSDPGLRG